MSACLDEDRNAAIWCRAVERVASDLTEDSAAAELVELLVDSGLALHCALSSASLHPADRAQLDRLLTQCKHLRDCVEAETKR